MNKTQTPSTFVKDSMARNCDPGFTGESRPDCDPGFAAQLTEPVNDPGFISEATPLDPRQAQGIQIHSDPHLDFSGLQRHFGTITESRDDMRLPMYDVDRLVFKRRRDNLQVTEAFIGGQHVATIYGLKKRNRVSELPVLRFGKFMIEFHDVPIPNVGGSDYWASHYEGAKQMIRTTLSIIPE